MKTKATAERLNFINKSCFAPPTPSPELWSENSPSGAQESQSLLNLHRIMMQTLIMNDVSPRIC